MMWSFHVASLTEKTSVGPTQPAITMATQAQPEKKAAVQQVAAQPEKTMATQQEKTMAMQQEKTMATQQEKTMAMQQEKTMATQQEKTMAMQQEKTMATQQEKTMAMQQEKTMATQQEKTMAMQQKDALPERKRKQVTSYEENKNAVPSTLATPTTPPPPPPVVQEPFRPVPMVINLERLAVLNKAPPTTVDPASSSLAGRPVIPIDVRTPNMLKVVLLQASGPDSAAGEMRPMDLISLSGVCLRNERGTWRMVAGSNFHDPPPTTSSDHTETFPLMGGVRAVFNHTQKCWYVLPPLTVTMGEPPLEQRGLTDSQKMGSVERPDSTPKPPDLFLSKKAIVTAVGGAINSMLAQFEQTRSVEEKKRIGSDTSNPNMGHLVRGSICTALARLLLDGLKPYRFQGLVSDDIWKVTSSFWQEGKASSSPDCPHILTPSITVHSCYQGSVVAISGQAGIPSNPISGR